MFEKNLGQFLIMEGDAIIVAIFIAFNGFYSVLSSFPLKCFTVSQAFKIYLPCRK